VLDQNVVNVLSIRDGKIASVAEHLADVTSLDTYFS
jgi:ketosteroid isomerase-like protein